MFVVKLSLFRIVAPRLRDAKVYIVLGVMDAIEIIRNASLNKIPQFGQFFVAQDGVVF